MSCARWPDVLPLCQILAGPAARGRISVGLRAASTECGHRSTQHGPRRAAQIRAAFDSSAAPLLRGHASADSSARFRWPARGRTRHRLDASSSCTPRVASDTRAALARHRTTPEKMHRTAADSDPRTIRVARQQGARHLSARRRASRRGPGGRRASCPRRLACCTRTPRRLPPPPCKSTVVAVTRRPPCSESAQIQMSSLQVADSRTELD